MSETPRTISLQTARRLVVSKQHLAGGKGRRAARNDLFSVVRDLAFVQIDTVSIVAPSHVLSLWSRVEDFRTSDLEQGLWREKTLFETPGDPVSIALTEDYPLHYSLMKRGPEPPTSWWGNRRARARQWLSAHEELRDSVLRQLEGSELSIDQFEGHVRTHRRADGWTSGSDVALTLAYLQMMGEVMVVGRNGNQKIWGLPGDFLPSWVERKEIPLAELERICAERSLRAQGTATRAEIYYYFPRGKYRELRAALSSLEDEGRLCRVQIEGLSSREPRYVHHEDLDLLDSLETGAWEPRLSLIAPFDNLITSRARTNLLFDLDYTHGNYLPPEKRKYGLYPLPILWGERLVGRIDPRLDKARGRLLINSVHAEPGAPTDRKIGEKIAETVGRLARFLGAKDVQYGPQAPRPWKSQLG